MVSENLIDGEQRYIHMVALRPSQDEQHADTSTQERVEKPTKRYQTMLLLSGFFMIFHIIGINSVFGIFQEFYTSPQSNVPTAQGRDALVSLVGTIGSGLTWSGSIFVNPIIARTDNPRWISVVGALVMSLGLFLASFSTQLWHLYFTQALLYGIGSSMYYFPIMSIAPVYFDRNRGFAMGVILAGSGAGGVVIAPVLQTLMDRYGIQWALRVLGIWNVIVGVPVSLVIRHRPGFGHRGRGRTRINMGLVKRGTFVYQSIGAFLQAAGNVIPLYYMTSYSTSVLAYSRTTGSLFVAINSGINSLSRIAMGMLADKVGRQNTMIVGALLSAFSVFALWYDAARSRFIAFVVLYGIYAGGYNALLPTTITEIYGTENYSSVNGFIYFIRGLGSILGAPLAGVILGSYNRNGHSGINIVGNSNVHVRIGKLGIRGTLEDASRLREKYNMVVVYDGILLLCAGLSVAYVRWLDARDKGRWRWKA